MAQANTSKDWCSMWIFHRAKQFMQNIKKFKPQTFCHKEKIHYLCALKSHYTAFVTSK